MSDVTVIGANGANGANAYGEFLSGGFYTVGAKPGGAGAGASATNNGNGVDLSNTATAIGGAGGRGGVGAAYYNGRYGPGAAGGAGGGAHASVSFSAHGPGSTYGYAKAVGGAGGGGYSVVGAGAGAGASASTAVTGGGAVNAKTYVQAGGGAFLGGAGGDATGSATAVSTTTGSDNVQATATVSAGDGAWGTLAYGGRHIIPDSQAGPAGAGGNVTGATSTASALSATGGTATAITRATAGAGGFDGGAGGTASGSTATASGYSATAIVYQTGGKGGSAYAGSYVGGAGGSSYLNNAVSASAHGGHAYLKQIATGGSYTFYQAVPGPAGAATSILKVIDTTASSITAVVGAYAGFGYVVGGRGASASVNVTALHTAIGQATAASGTGVYTGAAAATVHVTGLGAGDTATALASAYSNYAPRFIGDSVFNGSTTSAGAYTAVGQRAQATARGASTSAATAGTGGAGVVTAITTSASAGNAGSYAVAGGDDLTYSLVAPGAFALATYSPSAAFTAAMQTAPHVKTAIGAVLAGAELGSKGASEGDSYNSAATFTLNGSGLAGDLILGLIAPDINTTDLSDLVFTVTINGVEKVDQTFTSLWSAETYFTDNAIDLGAFAGQSAIQVVTSLTLDSYNSIGEGFDTNFVLGEQAPAPTSLIVPNGATSFLLSPASPGQGPGPYAVTANSDPDLVITDRAGTNDLITLGAAGQSVLTFGIGSNDYIFATPAEAGDLVRSLNHTADILEITSGGTFALNPGDFDVLVKLDQPSTLTLAGFQAGVEGNTGGDTIIVPGRQLWSTSGIDLGGGGNTLTLQGGGYFDLRAPAVLTGVQTLNAQEGQGSGEQTVYLRDGLDLTVNVASSAGGGIVIHGADNADVINLGSGNDTVYVGGANETVNGGGGNDTFYASGAAIGAHIDGGTGVSTLALSGGGSEGIGGDFITNITQVDLLAAPAGQSQSAWTFAAVVNDPGLKIFDFAKTADTISFFGGGQTAADIGAGGDTFRFVLPIGGVDQINLFQSGHDHIGLHSHGLTSLSDATFDFGSTPTAADDGKFNILYETRTGALSYDASGGDGHVVQFATLTGHPTLLASDFTLA